VDIVDALLFTRSQQEGSEIQSFDKDIQKLIKRLAGKVG
jgi:predicted nucleic acid-binding protein